MRTPSLTLLALLATAAADRPRVNGWYPCAFTTTTDLTSYGLNYDDMTVFECAKVRVPLCYDGVCESDESMDVFVKRRLATKTDDAKKALILIQGGPGDASTNLEDLFFSLTPLLDDAVDFYTFDHRGTGRSEFLSCDAAQAATAGSPDGTTISTEELALCLADLNVQYDGQAAAFSTTSAAMDVRTIIETFMETQDVYVAGYSYGTFVAQRVLQLNVPQVVGYIFDSVDALSVKGDPVETCNSHWNKAIQAPGRRLLEFCFDDADNCPLTFKSRDTVVNETFALFAKLDKESDTNVCAKIIASGTSTKVPSEGLRIWMSDFVGSGATRNKALTVLGHAQHCSKEDAQALRDIFGTYVDLDDEDEDEDVDAQETEVKKYKFFQGPMKSKRAVHHVRSDNVPDPLDDSNPLLYNLIVSSERWSQPAPTKKERQAFFEGGIFSTDDSAQALEYCLVTGSKEPACQELQDELPEPKDDKDDGRTTTFFYKHDKYFDMPLELPAHASALIFNGGLDFATPREFGELLYSKLKGSGNGVMMVSFDFGTHCNGEAVGDSTDTPCHDAIMASFIKHNGAVDKVDTGCMTELPVASFGADEY